MAVMPDLLRDPEAVPLGLLRRYLSAKGWRQAGGGRGAGNPVRPDVARALIDGRANGRRNFDLYVLSEDGFDDIEIVLPKAPGSLDFLRQVEGAIRTLSDVEGRAPDQVAMAVRAIGFDVIRSRIPDSRPERVFGRVERLQSQDNPSDLLTPGGREIGIQWSSDDLGDLLVKVSLTPTDYLVAIEAHKAGRPVMVSGTLQGKGRS